MVPHFHGGFAAFLTVTLYAIIGMNLTRLAAAKAADSENATLQNIGRTVGSLVTFGGGGGR